MEFTEKVSAKDEMTSSRREISRQNAKRGNFLTQILVKSPECPRLYNYYISNMEVTVEVSEEELKDILRATCEKRKGAAIRQLALEALMLKKRRELLDEAEAGK